MRVQHVFVVALLAAAVCIAESSAISREEKEPATSIWRRFQNMSKEQRKTTFNSILEQTPRNALDDKIIALIESCIKNPALDPVEIPYINIFIQESFANFTGHMDTVSLDGISTLTVNKLHIGILTLKVDFELTLPSISLRGNYDLDGVFAGLLPIYGRGPFLLSGSDVSVKGAVSIKLGADGAIEIRSMTLDLGLGGFLFDFKNLLDNPELSDVINEMINDLGAAFLTKYEVAIETAIVTALTTTVNSARITIADIKGGGGTGPSFCTAA